jgi:toxin-antitoxin system PIN domain toxin
MIAVDTNILVHAHRADSEWHEPARDALRRLDAGTERWAIPWPCIFEFFAIITHPRIFPDPSPPEVAWDALSGFLESETVILLSEPPGFFPRLHELLGPLQLRGPKIHDARIAALCQVHGVRELWSQDRDFSRFPFVITRNPLVGRPSSHRPPST